MGRLALWKFLPDNQRSIADALSIGVNSCFGRLIHLKIAEAARDVFHARHHSSHELRTDVRRREVGMHPHLAMQNHGP